jgi:hypothetical protein
MLNTETPLTTADESRLDASGRSDKLVGAIRVEFGISLLQPSESDFECSFSQHPIRYLTDVLINMAKKAPTPTTTP